MWRKNDRDEAEGSGVNVVAEREKVLRAWAGEGLKVRERGRR